MAAIIAGDMASSLGGEFEFRSAGLMAGPGMPASGGAVRAAEGRGLDLSGHESSPLTAKDLEWADLVLGMTHSHVDSIRDQAPDVPRVPVTGFLPNDDPLAGASIGDPFGGSDEEYEVVWQALERAIEVMIRRLLNAPADD
jgi:protein-tyrosine-phosphatase